MSRGQIDAAGILRAAAHRPWSLPDEPWVMLQSWQNLLFLHWPVAVEQLRPLVPASLELDLHDGQAWVGITPFALRGLRVRGLPGIPSASNFLELNVRTYVRSAGRGGVFFFSLDAQSRLAVLGARLGFGLPYHHAGMRMREGADVIRLRSHRRGGGADFVVRYGPSGAAEHPRPGTLEHFLTERYALFVERGGVLLRGDIHHAPWPLQPAHAVIEENTMAAAAGITLPELGPLQHFSLRQDTLIWRPRREPPAAS